MVADNPPLQEPKFLCCVKNRFTDMENIPSLLVLCGKTDAEEDCARSLKENKNLKLADGRAKNVWESPSGCLLFSYTLQMENGHILPLLQYVVSLAIIEAIKMVCGSKGFPYLDVRIKWPNDLYLNGLKVGGVGLNLDNEKPTTCLNAVLRELTCSTNQLTREDILAAFFQKFEDLFVIFLNQGFQALEDLYYKAWLHSGKKVVIEEKDEESSAKNVVVTKASEDLQDGGFGVSSIFTDIIYRELKWSER
ncbi:hypothetical protein QJS10_CPA03g01902 [Acorus calamus]|uniref:BPL/LPL catalytic domain-containing protein n=1 Tax=Acorus calamus TaxID=4465 RepID=A0AAV9FA94_ACOCL|nr:hypothetical protein QJS10_CPA03g01902 [Acorus calamus]